MIIEHLKNFTKISKLYNKEGFRYVEVPWLVSRASDAATRPPTSLRLEVRYTAFTGVLVGSGEQGFIEMLRHGTLTPGKYQTITPCFRDEGSITVYSKVRKSYFSKLELIQVLDKKPSKIDRKYLSKNMAASALEAMSSISKLRLKIEETDIGFDIICKDNKLELGSYGYRKIDDCLPYIYGTGLAEPRFTICKENLK